MFGDLSLGGLLSTIISGAGYANQLNRLGDFGTQAQAGAERIGQQAAEGTRFVPFTVTGSTGAGVGTTPEGSTQFNLSPQEQALQNQLFGGAGQFYSQAQAPIAQTEQDIFNRMLQVAAPERQRQQLGLEERLAAQGRLGTSSAAYGGATPEQMALATAQQQQLNQLGLQARGQALSERGQALEMGRGLLSAGFAPEAQLLNLIQPAINISSLQGTGQREGANLAAQLQIAQMQAQANAAKAEANRRAQLTGAAGGFLTGQQTGGGPSIFEQLLGGLFGGSFGGRQPDFIKDVYNTPQTTTNQPNPDIYGMA